jgi:hypothetical protein
LRSWWSSSIGFLPFVVAWRSHDAPRTKNNSWQKQVEMKTWWKHDIQTSGNPRGYIGEN